MESSFSVIDYLGKPISQIIESPYFKPLPPPVIPQQKSSAKSKHSSPPR